MSVIRENARLDQLRPDIDQLVIATRPVLHVEVWKGKSTHMGRVEKWEIFPRSTDL